MLSSYIFFFRSPHIFSPNPPLFIFIYINYLIHVFVFVMGPRCWGGLNLCNFLHPRGWRLIQLWLMLNLRQQTHLFRSRAHVAHWFWRLEINIVHLLWLIFWRLLRYLLWTGRSLSVSFQTPLHPRASYFTQIQSAWQISKRFFVFRSHCILYGWRYFFSIIQLKNKFIKFIVLALN